MTLSLFQKTQKKPLADEVRPSTLEEVYGQEHLFGDGTVINKMSKQKHLSSIILWGPTGCGKTTIARILAQACDHYFESISAVINGTADLKKTFEQAELRAESGASTVMLVDEIHRFNKAQQDVFLPYLENGIIILIGATTENPSFTLNSALLSRCKVLTLNRLSDEAMESIVRRVEKQKGQSLPIVKEAYKHLYQFADGDGRYLLNMCEDLFSLKNEKKLKLSELAKHLQKRLPIHDKSQDMHYGLKSALFKSIRGSDCNAALYWLARMLEAGEDPLVIIRHLVRQASEDIGMSDPTALRQVLSAKYAYNFLGSPEGDLAIAQAVIYLATAPKSNSVYKASKSATEVSRSNGSLSPPKHILNAPTEFMRQQGYGAGYIYDHDTKHAFSGQSYLPEVIEEISLYNPVDRGFEREIKKRLEYWHSLKTKNKT